jgi:hypothetical protein
MADRTDQPARKAHRVVRYGRNTKVAGGRRGGCLSVDMCVRRGGGNERERIDGMEPIPLYTYSSVPDAPAQ